MKLLLFADLHLDAPFTWARPETAAVRRQNRRDTLVRILELAEAERVDAILAAGDLFEHDRIAPDTVEFLRASLARTDIPVYVAPGNHDWLSETSPYAVTDWSPNVHLFKEDRLTPVSLADGLTLWGAAHRAPANTDGFFTAFRPDRGGVHLAVAHASERGFLAQQGSGKLPHAPFDAAELEAADIAHAFLGHFHLPRDADRYTYPGNPDPLDFGETGERGAVLATVSPDGSVTRERRAVATSVVHDVEVPLDDAVHADDVRARVEAALAALGGCVRVTLTGEVAPSVAIDLAALGTVGSHLDGLVMRTGALTVAYDLDVLAAEATIRGQFVRLAQSEITDLEHQRRVIVTGLRALDGRRDLEVA
jgi:DNA repair exonuclease SbcCD nuclease subunit